MASVFDNFVGIRDLEVDGTTVVVDEVNNRLGIGVSDPSHTLEVFSTSSQQKWSYDANSFATITVADSSATTLATGEDTGDLTLDADNIILDSYEGKWRLKRNTTLTCLISQTAGDGGSLIFDNQVSDADIVFKGSDGGSGISALTLDMSEDGAAIFKSRATIGTGTAVDTMLTFDGHAQDFRIGLDDGNDQLEIGHGTSHGTNTAITVNSSGQVTTFKLPAAAVAQASDHIMFFDGGATGAPKVESIDDFLTAIAGSGISVSSSQLTSSGITANDASLILHMQVFS